ARQFPDLGFAAPVGGEIDESAVSRPTRIDIGAAAGREPAHRARIHVDHANLRSSVCSRLVSDSLGVRRPSGGRAESGYALEIGSVQAGSPDLGWPRADRAEHQSAPR